MEMVTGLMWQVYNESPTRWLIFYCSSLIGTVIGDNFGLARKATAIAVRVLNDNGSGSFAYVLYCQFPNNIVVLISYRGVVSGVDYSANQHMERKVPSVAK